MFHFKQYLNSNISLPFCLIIPFCIYINSLDFAIGDDFHALNFYFLYGKLSFIDAIITYAKDPFMAGRPIAGILELFPLFFVSDISDFSYIRYLHLFLFYTIYVLLIKNINLTNFNTRTSSIIAFSAFLNPGLWHMYVMNYGTSMLVAIIALLQASLLLVKERLSFYYIFLIFALILLAIFSYQPSWPIVFLGLTCLLVRVLDASTKAGNNKCNELMKKQISVFFLNYFICLILVGVVLSLNFIIVKFFMHTPRLDFSSSILFRLEYIWDHYLPLVVIPFAHVFYPKSNLSAASLFIYLISIFVIAKPIVNLFIVNKNILSTYKLRKNFILLSVVTSLFFLVFFMFFYTSPSISHRRFTFISIFYWQIFLVFLFLMINNLSHSLRKYFVILLFSLMIFYCFYFLYFFSVGTAKYASIEYTTTVCAVENSTPLENPAIINSTNAIKPILFPNFLSNEEFQVSTYRYPSARWLVWIVSNNFFNHSSFNPWELILQNETLSEWDLNYTECFRKKKLQ